MSFFKTTVFLNLGYFEGVVIPFGGVQKDAFEYSKAEFVRDH